MKEKRSENQKRVADKTKHADKKAPVEEEAKVKKTSKKAPVEEAEVVEKAKKASKKPKKEKPKEEKPAEEQPKQKKPNPLLNMVKANGFDGMMDVLRSLGHVFSLYGGKLLKSVVFDEIDIYVIVGKGDAAETAIAYGKMCQKVYPLVGFLCSNNVVHKYDVLVDPDFLANRSEGEIFIDFHMVIRKVINATVGMVVRLIFQVLRGSLRALIVSLGQALNLPEVAGVLLKIMQYSGLITLAVMVLVILLTYTFLQGEKRKLRCQLPGAVFTTVLWLVFSVVFEIFITRFWKASSLYGSLASIFLAAMWLKTITTILFYGEALNVALQEQRDAAQEN